ncbi:hypothetical protein GO988_23555 [Hymenobacter sp. HMF4947]|uniref:Uncharacterized protein n=1 Tax=Hymenobacter ginkgonis TaxID=2682976 RepID=A0A7K1TLP2_9BACT|nr:hypothetical protein [Hymenobacter ginkgonis]MVN79320.1 hypothetical protein [Hymenobacter ginkgonis]
MSTLHLRLSPLPPVADFLLENAPHNQTLQDALDDGLEDYTEGGEVIMMALRDGLDEWLSHSSFLLRQTNQFTQPYVFLAGSAHIEAVQAFRDLL